MNQSYKDLVKYIRSNRRQIESDKGDNAKPCPECGAPKGSGHYAICHKSN